MDKLPKYIVATKQIHYAVSDILEDNGITDYSTLSLDELVELIDETITQDFGYEEPLPDFTYEYEGEITNA